MSHKDPQDIQTIHHQLLREIQQPEFMPTAEGNAKIAALGRQAIVCAGSPEHSGRPVGAIGRKARGIVFRLTRFYVDPLVQQQRSFNLALVRHIAVLEQRIAELEGEKPSGKQ